MRAIKTRISIGPDGDISGRAGGLPTGEHDAQIILLDGPSPPVRDEMEDLLARVRAIQAELARLPVLDDRSPDEIIGYNPSGHFD